MEQSRSPQEHPRETLEDGERRILGSVCSDFALVQILADALGTVLVLAAALDSAFAAVLRPLGRSL
jgi:hypothetical protein